MKDGSRGVICMAIKSMKLGIAVKLEDGWTDEFQGIIIANILEQLKYDDAELIEKLKNCYSTKLYNDCGIEVGHSEADFKLDIDPSFFEPAEEYIDSDIESDDKSSDISDPALPGEDIDENIDDVSVDSLYQDSKAKDMEFSSNTLESEGSDPDKDSAFDRKVAAAYDKVSKPKKRMMIQ